MATLFTKSCADSASATEAAQQRAAVNRANLAVPIRGCFIVALLGSSRQEARFPLIWFAVRCSARLLRRFHSLGCLRVTKAQLVRKASSLGVVVLQRRAGEAGELSPHPAY